MLCATNECVTTRGGRDDEQFRSLPTAHHMPQARSVPNTPDARRGVLEVTPHQNLTQPGNPSCVLEPSRRLTSAARAWAVAACALAALERFPIALIAPNHHKALMLRPCDGSPPRSLCT